MVLRIKQLVFVEGLTELTRAMVAPSEDTAGVNAALDKMAAGLGGWELTATVPAGGALIDDDEVIYFRDIYDHLIRLADEIDNYRELASSTLDVYLTQVNNNLGITVKRLTGVTVVLAGIGAVAGLFGMSEAASWPHAT